MPKHHRFPLKSDASSAVVGAFSFTTDGTTDPSVWDDPDGCISSITETGTGLFTVTLSDQYRKLKAIAQHDSITYGAQVTSATASTGVITIQQTVMSTHAANAASDGDEIIVFYFAQH